MSDLYCNNGCPYERIGKCPENGMPERCGIQAMYAEIAAAKAELKTEKERVVLLEANNAWFKAERDAALSDITPKCRICANYARCFSEPHTHGNYNSYQHCHERDMGDFEWRGVQEGADHE